MDGGLNVALVVVGRQDPPALHAFDQHLILPQGSPRLSTMLATMPFTWNLLYDPSVPVRASVARLTKC